MHVVQGCCRISASVGFYMQIGCFYERSHSGSHRPEEMKTNISKIYTNVFNYEIMIHVIHVHYYKPPFISTTTQYTQSKDSILTQPLVMLVSGRCLVELTSNDSWKGL